MLIKLKNNKKINVDIKGEGDAIFFVHSYLWDKKMWTPQVEELSKKYKCVSIDLWGHGDSELLDEEEHCTLSTLADNIIEVANSLDIERFYYVGLSVGAMIGTYLGLNYKEKIKKMVLMDGYSGVEPKETKEKYFYLLKTIKGLGYIPSDIANMIAPMFFTKNETLNEGSLYREFKEKLINEKRENINTVVMLGEAIFGRDGVLEEMNKIETPTLFMVGDEDIPRPTFESQEMCDLVKNSQLIVVPRAGHISNLENPIFVIEKILNFFTKEN